MSDTAFDAYVVELKARHDEGKIDDAQYWAAMLGVANGYAQRDRLNLAVQHLQLVPEAFLRAIPASSRPRLQETAVELARRLLDEGIACPPLTAASGRPS